MSTFDRIHGYAEIKVELEKICHILRCPEEYRAFGVNTPRGLLLYGAPGVGKTLMAEALIAESGHPAYTCRKNASGEAFLTAVRETFAQAKAHAPAIVLLDDMDKFSEEEQCATPEEYAAVQAGIDEVKDAEVFVIATANDIDNIPESLLRSGRFDRKIEVDAPVGDDATEIVGYYLAEKGMRHLDATKVARLLSGHSCAELATIINEAGLYAVYEKALEITMDHMVRSTLAVLFGITGNLSNNTPEMDQRIAYHEAAHAVAAEVLNPGSVVLVTVKGTGKGFTLCYNKSHAVSGQQEMEQDIMCALAGRCETELRYGDVDMGAENDLHRSHCRAEHFIKYLAGAGFGATEFGCMDEFSDEHKRRQEKSCQAILDRLHGSVRELLITYQDFVQETAERLMKEPYLTEDYFRQARKKYVHDGKEVA